MDKHLLGLMNMQAREGVAMDWQDNLAYYKRFFVDYEIDKHPSH
jgi:hypothetical protein